MFWLKESQKAVNLDIKIRYYKFPASKAATILTKVVTSQRLFMIIQASVINSYHLSFQFSDYAHTRNASCALNLISII
jgi:Pyruvate/2-oxoacid:ferredoxin oxidoreductase gamma subunit